MSTEKDTLIPMSVLNYPLGLTGLALLTVSEKRQIISLMKV